MDGIPLQPLANDPSVEANRDLLFEAFDLGEAHLGRSFGIRRGQWVYNQYSNGEEAEELYNMSSDPYQLQNLLYDPPGVDAPSPEHLALADQLSIRLAQLKGCAGASCR